MLNSLMNVVFGCSHRRTTFPLTPARKVGFSASSASPRHGTYVVCLDCGKEFGYNWTEMHIGDAVVAPAAPVTAAATFSEAHR
jgi:hypothetical protein